MSLLFICTTSVYLLFLLVLLAGWRIAFRKVQENTVHGQCMISVVIPFRNEKKGLPDLLMSLGALCYPRDKFEVILVDDHSHDNFVPTLNALIQPHKNFRLVSADAEGKKQALAKGISLAVGDIIVTTDADCTVLPDWLDLINAGFENPEVKMIMGSVGIQPQASFFSKLQVMEFCSLSGTAAATCALGTPLFCNGANLAFRKVAYQKVNGYEGNFHIPSGDDEFLMRKIHTDYGKGSVVFLNSQRSLVKTMPLSTLSDFFQQRIRWAAKWKYNASIGVRFSAVFIWIFQLVWMYSIAASLHQPAALLDPLLIAKIFLEAIFLYQVASFQRVRFSVLAFLVLQFVYPFYVVAVGISSNFIKVTWKGRTSTPA